MRTSDKTYAAAVSNLLGRERFNHHAGWLQIGQVAQSRWMTVGIRGKQTWWKEPLVPRMSTSSPTEISTWGCTIALWSRLSVACERSQHTCVCPSCDSGLCRATPLCIACQVKLWITAGQTRQEHSFYRQPLRPSRYASCHAMTPVEVVVQPADYWQQLNHAAGKQQTTQVSTLPAQQPPVGSLYCSTGWRRRFIRQQSSHNAHMQWTS